MNTLISIFWLSFLVALSGAVTPGPMLTMTVRKVYREGFLAGPLLVVGHSLLEALMVLVLMAGLRPLLVNKYTVFLVSLAGGVFLLWMAWPMLKETMEELSFEGKAAASRELPTLFTGILVSLSNPYWFIWWISIGAALLYSSNRLGFGGLVSFFSGHISGDFAWYGLVSLLVFKGKDFLHSRFYFYLLKACGVFLVLFGFSFFYLAFQKLF